MFCNIAIFPISFILLHCIIASVLAEQLFSTLTNNSNQLFIVKNKPDEKYLSRDYNMALVSLSISKHYHTAHIVQHEEVE